MRISTFLLFVLLSLSALAIAQQVSGDYVETRNADVYTGSCFANSEAGLVGNTAILGWHVQKGSWNGVSLEGLGVAAVVRARATLGDPYGNPYPAKAVVIVDEQANAQQRAALVDFARHAGGELLAHVVRVEVAPVELAVPHHGMAILRAGAATMVRTRALNQGDHLCGNEETYYPPLTSLSHSTPTVAETDEYRGSDLGTTWELHGKRSAFVGTFAMPQSPSAVATVAHASR
jgi:hypothetical protein